MAFRPHLSERQVQCLVDAMARREKTLEGVKRNKWPASSKAMAMGEISFDLASLQSILDDFADPTNPKVQHQRSAA